MTRQSQVFFVGASDESKKIVSAAASMQLKCEVFFSGGDFLKAYGGNQGGCLVLDARLADMNALDVLTSLSGVGFGLPAVLIIGEGDVKTVVRALNSGAVDVLEAPWKVQQLRRSIQAAIKADADARPRMQQQAEIESRRQRLTPQENEVMNHVLDGKTNAAIASKLDVSQRTVVFRRDAVLKKMEADSVVHLVRLDVALSRLRRQNDPCRRYFPRSEGAAPLPVMANDVAM